MAQALWEHNLYVTYRRDYRVRSRSRLKTRPKFKLGVSTNMGTGWQEDPIKVTTHWPTAYYKKHSEVLQMHVNTVNEQSINEESFVARNLSLINTFTGKIEFCLWVVLRWKQTTKGMWLNLQLNMTRKSTIPSMKRSEKP